MSNTSPAVHRYGSVAIVGRPNVGKSSLLNRLIGANLSIVSRKAQTTRHRILGILTQPDAQVVFLDTPGFQTRHTAALNRQLNRAALATLGDADLVVWVGAMPFLIDEDRQILERLPTDLPVIAVLNKTDLLDNDRDRQRAFEMAAQLSQIREFATIVPISAEKGFQTDVLLQEIISRLPEGEAVFGEEEFTDRGVRFLAAEIIREKLFRLTGDEIPYSSTVVIDSMKETGANQMEIHASIIVARASQKPILIGHGGEQIRRIGTEARTGLNELTGKRVHLELWVRVKENWADDDAAVRAYGYDQT